METVMESATTTAMTELRVGFVVEIYFISDSPISILLDVTPNGLPDMNVRYRASLAPVGNESA
jgi:hypothetical protein